MQKNLMDAGSRPASLASLRIFAILGARTEGACPVTKIASACLDAKAEPALNPSVRRLIHNFGMTDGEVPAWKRNGVLCGEGSTMCLVSRLKYLP